VTLTRTDMSETWRRRPGRSEARLRRRSGRDLDAHREVAAALAVLDELEVLCDAME
jgi:hypothetical protein